MRKENLRKRELKGLCGGGEKLKGGMEKRERIKKTTFPLYAIFGV